MTTQMIEEVLTNWTTEAGHYSEVEVRDHLYNRRVKEAQTHTLIFVHWPCPLSSPNLCPISLFSYASYRIIRCSIHACINIFVTSRRLSSTACAIHNTNGRNTSEAKLRPSRAAVSLRGPRGRSYHGSPLFMFLDAMIYAYIKRNKVRTRRQELG